MILLDLQKAFDTIDHQILLKKMKYLGFSKNTTAWFKPYLCERKFKLSINTAAFFINNPFLTLAAKIV